MIEVALTTFNGAKWLHPQLLSITGQTVPVKRIVIRDDGSNDATKDIISALHIESDSHVRLLPYDGLNLGPRGCFNRVLESTEGEYVFLCDQDDVWDKRKVETCLREIAQLEAKHGSDTPLYVYSDTRLVDSQGDVIAESGWRAQGFDGLSGMRFERLLVQNVVPGCAMMVNRKLLDQALPIPSDAPMHDWWLLLVGCAFGHGACVREPLVDYRQHNSNNLGAIPWGAAGLADRLRQGPLFTLKKIRENYGKALRQAQCFQRRYAHALPDGKRETLQAFCKLPTLSWLRRRHMAVRLRIRKDSWLRSLALYLII